MQNPSSGSLRMSTVTAVWWPLAASWLFMALEVPVVSAALARMPQPEIQLAAFGGIVYPLILIVESPIIMLLAASTALCRDWHAYVTLRRYVGRMSGALTLLHLALVATPLYDLVVRGLIGAPDAIVDPARVGLLVTLPWTWSIADRRFHQGVLIRYGHSRAIGVGTVLRLGTTTTVLLSGLAFTRWFPGTPLPGVALGAAGVISGVIAEVIFVRLRTRPVVAEVFDPETPARDPIDLRRFVNFYVPLALTSLLSLLIQPIGSAAISRMPVTIPSLAGWPVVIGLVFVLRSGGTSYKEVVVAMLERPDPWPAMRSFTRRLAAGTFVATVAIAFTPLTDLWLRRASGLGPDLADLAGTALAVGMLIPVAGVAQNWYVGILVHAHRTRAVTESMVAFLIASGTVFAVGIVMQPAAGLLVALAAFTAGNLAQLAWVWRAAQPLLPPPTPAAGIGTPIAGAAAD